MWPYIYIYSISIILNQLVLFILFNCFQCQHQSYENSGIEEYIPSHDDDVDLEAFYADDDDDNEEDNLIKNKKLYKR